MDEAESGSNTWLHAWSSSFWEPLGSNSTDGYVKKWPNKKIFGLRIEKKTWFAPKTWRDGNYVDNMGPNNNILYVQYHNQESDIIELAVQFLYVDAAETEQKGHNQRLLFIWTEKLLD